MGKPLSGVGLSFVGIGSILVYAGIKGYSMPEVVANLIKGRPAATDVKIPLTTGTPEGAPAPSLEGSAAGDPKTIARSLMGGYGWGEAEWIALEQLWTRESSWNPKAENKQSGAYGIPQALPYTKMPQPAWPERFGGTSDAYTQIQWGLSYIRQRYGSPVMAWAFWQKNRWY